MQADRTQRDHPIRALYTNKEASRHKTGGAPEGPGRIAAVLDRIPLEPIVVDSSLTAEFVKRVHPAGYLARLEAACPPRSVRKFNDNPDMPLSKFSATAALNAAATGVQAVGDVILGNVEHAFCAIRPPGHHAYLQPEGFCLLNNIALAATRALDLLPPEGDPRIVIVDIDAHHCNGTEGWLKAQKLQNAHCISTHRVPGRGQVKPFYPSTGFKSSPTNNIVNKPIPFGEGSRDAVLRFYREELPYDLKPDLVLVAAGFDGHKTDPIGSMGLETEDYRFIGEAISKFGAPTVSLLEGGYNLDVLGDCASAFFDGITGRARQPALKRSRR